MNRREALAALMSLPATARVSVAQLAPTDVIVLESDHLLSRPERDRIVQQMKLVWPDHQCIVCDNALRLKVYHRA